MLAFAGTGVDSFFAAREVDEGQFDGGLGGERGDLEGEDDGGVAAGSPSVGGVDLVVEIAEGEGLGELGEAGDFLLCAVLDN